MKKPKVGRSVTPNSKSTTHKALAALAGFVLRKIEKLALNADEFLMELQNRVRGQRQPLVSVPLDKLNVVTSIKDAVDEYREAIGYTPGGELVHFKNGHVKPVSLSESVKLFRDITVLWLMVDHKFDSYQDREAYLRWLAAIEAAMCRTTTERNTALLMVEVDARTLGVFTAGATQRRCTVEQAAQNFIGHGDALSQWERDEYAS